MSTQDQDQENNTKSGISMASRKLTPLLTVNEVADYISLEPDSVRGLAREGRIPATKLGKVWRFKLEEINEWILEGHN